MTESTTIPFRANGHIEDRSPEFLSAQWRILQHNLQSLKDQSNAPREFYKVGREGHVRVESTHRNRKRR